MLRFFVSFSVSLPDNWNFIYVNTTNADYSKYSKLYNKKEEATAKYASMLRTWAMKIIEKGTNASEEEEEAGEFVETEV